MRSDKLHIMRLLEPGKVPANGLMCQGNSKPSLSSLSLFLPFCLPVHATPISPSPPILNSHKSQDRDAESERDTNNSSQVDDSSRVIPRLTSNHSTIDYLFLLSLPLFANVGERGSIRHLFCNQVTARNGRKCLADRVAIVLLI